MSDNTTNPPPPVLLIHGYAGHRLLWWRFARALRSEGFEPKPWGYRSVWSDIESFAQKLSKQIHAIEEATSVGSFHVVTHSMGGVLLRTALASFPRPVEKLKRIVMLCPPNQGSHAATRLAKLAGWFSPSLPQIADHESSFVNQLPRDFALQREVGLLVAQGDLVVHPEATQLPGLKDQCNVPGMHSAVLMRKDAIEQTIAFLHDGQFRS